MDRIKLVESFDDLPTVSLTEDSVDKLTESSKAKMSRVDGKFIIGMIEGQFFKPNGMSRNERFYPAELWETVLAKADVKSRCLNSVMFGEIGHSDGPVEDMTLRLGSVSHFIDELWITPKNEGMGRAYILNTPAGQLLKTYLGAGCKLKVSSRGEGAFCESKTYEGRPVIDPNTYDLQTFDFVLNPGFLETSALLKEQYEKVICEKPNLQEINETIAHVTKEGETPMTLDVNTYVQDLKDERTALKAKIESLEQELKVKDKQLLEGKLKVDAEIEKLNEEIKPYKALNISAKQIKEAFKKGQDSIRKVKEENQKLSEELAKYKEKAGSLEELDLATQLSNKALSLVESYKKQGSIDELAQLKENAEAMVEKYNAVNEELAKYKEEVGSLEDLEKSKEITKKATATIESYISLGEVEDIKALYENASKMCELVKEAKELSKVSEKAADLLEQYRALGTVEEISKLKELAEKVTESQAVNESVDPKVETKVTLQEAKEFAATNKCTIEEAAKLIKKYGTEKAKSFLETEEIREVSVEGVENSTQLIKEEQEKVKLETEKTAKDFLTKGMIVNDFNLEALGKEIGPVDINKIISEDPKKENAATALLKKFGAVKTEQPDVKVDNKAITPEQAEKAAKQMVK